MRLSKVWTLAGPQNAAACAVAPVPWAHTVDTHVLGPVRRLSHWDCNGMRVCRRVHGAAVEELALVRLLLEEFLFEFLAISQILLVC